MPTHSPNIEPALVGTRYGEALANAEQARAQWRQREWVRIILSPKFAKRAAQWAEVLGEFADGEWHAFHCTKYAALETAIDEQWLQGRGKTRSREYAITPLGIQWLECYRKHHSQK